eukprot:comp23505_c0_seq2/m.39385 comp23505_c0_seq2/g.39385  ORF comp23505_c0_seq2/g.39385 comp23505_c0_seq2/m.39385 type:complete len:371 (-) comp23505_c0_seq2:459-1571(-)
MTLEILKQLDRYQPDDKEKAALLEYAGDRERMAIADRFLYQMVSGVHRFEHRIKAMIIRRTFAEDLARLEEWVADLMLAAQEVQSSMSLREVLSLLLMVGNYMNCSIPNVGSVDGFKVEYLPKLGNTKAADNKLSLNNYMAAILRAKAPELLDFDEELLHTENASKVQIQVLQADMKEMRTALAGLKEELEKHSAWAEGDFFKSKYDAFYDRAWSQFQALEADYAKMMEDLGTAMKFFACDTNTTSVDEFFGIFWEFCKQLKAAHKENLAREEQLERAKRREEAMALRKMQEASRKKGQQRQSRGGPAGMKREAGLEDVLTSLRTGNAFNENDKGEDDVSAFEKMLGAGYAWRGLDTPEALPAPVEVAAS